jgi:hypothetical protein
MSDDALIEKMLGAYLIAVRGTHDRERMRAALAVARKEILEEARVAAVAAVNSCRADGESDLRAARSRVDYAIRSLAEQEHTP